MADCFRLFYKKICCDVLCCQKCDRRQRRERLKLRRRRQLAEQRSDRIQPELPVAMYSFMDEEEAGLRRAFADHLAVTRQVFPNDSTTSKNQVGANENYAFEDDRTDDAVDTSSPSITLTKRAYSSSRISQMSQSLVSFETCDRFGLSLLDISPETDILGDDDDDDVDVPIVENVSIGIPHEPGKPSSAPSKPTRRNAVDDYATLPLARHPGKTPEMNHIQDGVDGDDEVFQINKVGLMSHHWHSDTHLNVFSSGNDVKFWQNDLTIQQIAKEKFLLSALTSNIKFNSNKFANCFNREGLVNRVTRPAGKQFQRAATVKLSRKVTHHGNKLGRSRHDNQEMIKLKSRATSCADKAQSSSKPLKRARSVKESGNSRKPRKTTSFLKGDKKRHHSLTVNQTMKRAHSLGAEFTSWDEIGCKSPKIRRSDESFVTAQSESVCSATTTPTCELIREPQIPSTQFLSPTPSNRRDRDLGIINPNFEMELRGLSNFGLTLEDQFGFPEDALDFDEDDKLESEEKVTVPISICLIVIGGYIVAGSALFTLWEGWDYLTGSYFCFITLSTIGFGDIVPGTDMKKWASHEKLVLCVLWLAFGLSLIAMCFNLMQEEVKDKCKWIGQKLGLLPDENEQ